MIKVMLFRVCSGNRARVCRCYQRHALLKTRALAPLTWAPFVYLVPYIYYSQGLPVVILASALYPSPNRLSVGYKTIIIAPGNVKVVQPFLPSDQNREFPNQEVSIPDGRFLLGGTP